MKLPAEPKTRRLRAQVFRAIHALGGTAMGFEVLRFLNSEEIFPTDASVRSTLSNMVQMNLLQVLHVKHECPGCGRPRVKYQPTEAGKIWYESRYAY